MFAVGSARFSGAPESVLRSPPMSDDYEPPMIEDREPVTEPLIGNRSESSSSTFN